MANQKAVGIISVITFVLIGIFATYSGIGDHPPTNERLLFCGKDSDCIPHPAYCHPTSCINKDFAQYYDAPLGCDEKFSYSAAYSPKDCSCIESRCLNKNLGRENQKEADYRHSNEGDYEEKNYCESRGGIFLRGTSIEGPTNYCLFEGTMSYCRAIEYMSGRCREGEEYYRCAATGTYYEGYYDSFNGDLLGRTSCR